MRTIDDTATTQAPDRNPNTGRLLTVVLIACIVIAVGAGILVNHLTNSATTDALASAGFTVPDKMTVETGHLCLGDACVRVTPADRAIGQTSVAMATEYELTNGGTITVYGIDAPSWAEIGHGNHWVRLEAYDSEGDFAIVISALIDGTLDEWL